MLDISPIQIVIVLVIALLVFGPSRLPEIGRTVGRGIREFRGAVSLGGDVPSARPVAGPRPATASGPSAATFAGDGDEDDVLEGVVVPGDTPPAMRQHPEH